MARNNNARVSISLQLIILKEIQPNSFRRTLESQYLSVLDLGYARAHNLLLNKQL